MIFLVYSAKYDNLFVRYLVIVSLPRINYPSMGYAVGNSEK